MMTLSIENIDDLLIDKLRIRAEENSRSVEEEVLDILKESLSFTEPRRGLGSRIQQAVMEISGPVDLELPARSLPRSNKYYDQ